MILRSYQIRTRNLLAAFIVIVICTLVYLFLFGTLSLQSFSTEESSLCTLIEAINRHLQDENSRGEIHATYGNETPVWVPPMVQDFQRITDFPEKLYLYSAYVDLEIQSVKLIGGALNGGSSLDVFCQFYNHKLEFLSTHEGHIEQVEIIWADATYAASFVICPLHQTDFSIPVPTYVSISTDVPNLRLENIFRISYQEVKTPQLEFALCVQPAFEYEQPLKFLEWIEFYKLMGVQAFTFYNVTIGPKTSCLMRAYAAAGKLEMEILKWNPVFKNEAEIPVHGQVIQLNDCIFRHRGRSKHVVSVDFDEMIMPTTAANFTEMIRELIQTGRVKDPNHVSDFKFRNGFFWISESLKKSAGHGHSPGKNIPRNFSGYTLFEDAIKVKLVISKFIREADITPPDSRTKYIAAPTLVRKALVHHILESKPRAYSFGVPPEIGYLHHYRNGGELRTWSSDELRSNGRVLEKSADRFRSKLAKIVAAKLRQLAQRCDLDLAKLI